MIIAHRGTDEKRDHIANLDSIVFNGDRESHYFMRKIIKFIFNYKDHQYENSALEFIKEIIEKLLQDNHNNNRNSEYEIIHTGHSLGGWLAVYAAAYHKQFFEKNISNVTRVVTFDCPGTLPMLERINLPSYNKLKVINYLSEPNPVNTCHPHFGAIFRVYPPIIILNDRGQTGTYSWLHKTVDAHSMQNILLCFDPRDGMPRKIRRIINWPSDGSKMVGNILDGFAMYISDRGSATFVQLFLLSLYHNIAPLFGLLDQYLKPSSPFIYHEAAVKYYLEQVRQANVNLNTRIKRYDDALLAIDDRIDEYLALTTKTAYIVEDINRRDLQEELFPKIINVPRNKLDELEAEINELKRTLSNNRNGFFAVNNNQNNELQQPIQPQNSSKSEQGWCMII